MVSQSLPLAFIKSSSPESNLKPKTSLLVAVRRSLASLLLYFLILYKRCAIESHGYSENFLLNRRVNLVFLSL